MSSPSFFTKKLGWLKPVSVLAALGLIIGFIVWWPGVDTHETPLEDGAVWAVQTGQGSRYAKVNLGFNELSSVTSSEDVSSLAQTEDAAFVFLSGNSRVFKVDQARPQEVGDADFLSLPQTPAGTQELYSQGEYLAYRTVQGSVYYSTFGQAATEARLFDPIDRSAESEQDPETRTRVNALAVAIDPEGQLFVLAEVNGQYLVYSHDLKTDEVIGSPQEITYTGSTETALQFGVAEGKWLLLSTDSSTYWSAENPVGAATGINGAYSLQRYSSADSLLLAGFTDLYRIQIGETAEQLVTGASGVPAIPVQLDGVDYAAWVSQNTAQLWNSADLSVELLDLGVSSIEAEPAPQFQISGRSAILNEQVTGLVWTLPDGQLVPSSVDWNLLDSTTTSETGDQVANVVSEPKPPVAEPDSFGVRAGALVRLPVLLNDHDPNEDVLTIVPESVTQLPADFGKVYLANEGQEFTVAIDSRASGSASFQYAVSDGTSSNGLTSAATTVTLNVLSGNSAPQWCELDGCLVQWPSPQVATGGSAVLDVLSNWVDPESDPLFLDRVELISGPGSVAWSTTGELTFKHPDPNANGGVTLLNIVVSDIHGAEATKELFITSIPVPRLRVEPFAVQGVVGEPLSINPGPHVFGNIGEYTISEPRILSGADESAELSLSRDRTELRLTAQRAGSFLISYSISDDIASETVTSRVEVLSPQSAQLSTTPAVAFLNGVDDITFSVIDSISNPGNRALSISGVELEVTEAAVPLQVRNINQTLLKISGGQSGTDPGKLGTIHYTVSDGSGRSGGTATGQVTVYQLSQSDLAVPVVIDDYVTVRAGNQVDIPVLNNDILQGTGQLALHQDISKASADDGGLVFASGAQVRYLAPERPGTYRLHYSAYNQKQSELSSTGTVHITVLGAEANTAPQTQLLTATVKSGNIVLIPFDSFGLDPDGDEVFLDRILTQPESGVAAIEPDGTAIRYTSVHGFEGQVEFEFQAIDRGGETAQGRVKVAVVDDPRFRSGIVPFTDYAIASASSSEPLILSPTANDFDSQGKPLFLVSVEPGVHEDSPDYEKIAALIGEISDDYRTVTILPTTELGTVPFIYRVANEPPTAEVELPATSVSGRIMLTVTADPPPDYPIVLDTVLDLETRAQFSQGIDVVTNKVSWNSGDISQLELELWQDTPGVTVSGWRIQGEPSAERQLIPFVLKTAEQQDVEEVRAYGFLRIPGEDDLRLYLKPEMPTFTVLENDTGTINLQDWVSHPVGSQLEFDQSAVESTGVRANGVCSVIGSVLNYSAGLDSPWNDLCIVPVKLQNQENFSYLAVPVRILPVDPIPTLSRGEIEIRPGTSGTFDLRTVTGWEDPGNTSPQVVHSYRVLENGGIFPDLAASGTGIQSIDMHVHASTAPGTEAVIEIASELGEHRVTEYLFVTVGPAPELLPKGGQLDVADACVNDGVTLSCRHDVIGLPNEVNPFDSVRYPLELVRVLPPASGTCQGTSFSVDGQFIVASWSPDTTGYKNCTVNFEVRDPQGKHNSDGRLSFTLHGKPNPISSVTQSGYGHKEIRLTVNRGDTGSWPEVRSYHLFNKATGEEILEMQCQQQHCSRVLTVAELPDIENGKVYDFEVSADNGVQRSPRVGISGAYSYRHSMAPTALSVSSIYVNPTLNTHEVGVMEFELQNNDNEVLEYNFILPEGSVLQSSTEVTTGTYRVTGLAADNEPVIRVQAVNAHGIPPAGADRLPSAGNADNFELAISGTRIAGKVRPPSNPSFGVNSAGNQINLSVGDTSGLRNGATGQLQVRYFLGAAATSTGAAEHHPDINSALNSCLAQGAPTSWGAGQTSGNFSVTPNRYYQAAVIVSNGYGCERYNFEMTGGAIFTWNDPGAPSGNFRYDVERNPVIEGNTVSYPASSLTLPNTPSADYTLRYFRGGAEIAEPTIGTLRWNIESQGISARYCSVADSSYCSEAEAELMRTHNQRSYPVRFQIPPSLEICPTWGGNWGDGPRLESVVGDAEIISNHYQTRWYGANPSPWSTGTLDLQLRQSLSQLHAPDLSHITCGTVQPDPDPDPDPEDPGEPTPEP